MSSLLSLDQHREALAANVATGRVWKNKRIPGSFAYKLLAGLAPSFLRLDESLERFVDQSFPFTTEDYLDEWERCLGIPDACFKSSSDDDVRRFQIEVKLRVMAGIQTRLDFQGLANLFGFTDYAFHSGIEHMPVSESGYELYTPELTIAAGDFASLTDARYTLVVVEGDAASVTFGDPEDADGADGIGWQFPLGFSAAGQVTLRCLIETLVEAPVRVIFVEEV